MTNAKGAPASEIQRDYRDASSVTHEEWLWLAEWLEQVASAAKRRSLDNRKYLMAAAGCRLLHKKTRESGYG